MMRSIISTSLCLTVQFVVYGTLFIDFAAADAHLHACAITAIDHLTLAAF